jgi:hypothetical protein
MSSLLKLFQTSSTLWHNPLLSHFHALFHVEDGYSACVSWGGGLRLEQLQQKQRSIPLQTPKASPTLMYIPVVGEVGGADVVALSGGTITVGTGSTQIRTRFDISPMLADLQKRTIYI